MLLKISALTKNPYQFELPHYGQRWKVLTDFDLLIEHDLTKLKCMSDSATILLSAEPVLPLDNYGRDSLNFAEFPLALLTERATKGKNSLVFSDVICDYSTGKEIRRCLTIASPDIYGLPTAKDEEIILGVLALSKEKNNFTDRTVQFTRSELLNRLGWSDQGSSYQRLVDSLNRWASVFLHYQNAWWDSNGKQWLDVSIHVFDSVIISKPQRMGQPSLIAVEWGKVAYESFKANYLKQIDLDFHQSLESATAKRLYRYLDKHFYRRDKLEFDLTIMACEHVGLSREYPPWKIKQKLENAITELEAKNYIVTVPNSERYLPAGKGKWRIVFTRKIERLPVATEESKSPEQESPLIEELAKRGVHQATAITLVDSTSAEWIELCIEAFDWLVKKKDRRVSKNPPGFLIESIRDEFPLPHGFTPMKVSKAKAAEKEQERLNQTKQRREEEEKIRTEREQAAQRKTKVDAYLKSLPEKARTEFVSQAIENGPTALLDSYRKAKEMGLDSFAEIHLYQLLEHAMNSF